MKITMNESKEKLPISYITSCISRGWDEVGNLKESLEAIKAEFKGTDDVIEVTQDFIDAYLIYIGRMNALLEEKKYIDMPEEAKDPINESLDEDTYVDIGKVTVNKPSIEIKQHRADPVPDFEKDLEARAVEYKKPVSKMPVDDLADEEETVVNESADGFDFVCDFDEPVGRPISEAELYPENLE